jgi:protein regulator of cytokinesis 1
VPPASIDGFVERYRGSTLDSVRAYEEELERMMELKRERMGVFVQSAREEIARLWGEGMVGEGEKRGFGGFLEEEEYTEELLAVHEEEIRRLKEERHLKGPLLGSVRRYFELCEEERELRDAAKDQSRLLGRGPRDPGRLLREEKMRRRVGREKPKVGTFSFLLCSVCSC